MKNKYIIYSIIVFIITILTLISFNQPIINKDGTIKLWCGIVQSSCNSQEITDWYSPSHFLHGVIFFWILFFLFLKYFKNNILNNNKYIIENYLYYKMLLIALVVECVWEIVENTPFIINRYRSTIASFDYSGDSVLNSGFDILFMLLGFIFAKKFGFKIPIFVFIFLELFTLYFIRDNLTLNVIMLLYPIEAIRLWQIG